MSTDEWLWGWDPTPGIVSVWAERGWSRDGLAPPARHGDRSIREDERFRPWILLDFPLETVASVAPQARARGASRVRELDGPGALRFLVSADSGQALAAEVLACASRRAGRHIGHLRDLGKASSLLLPPEEQYLVATGRTYFRDLAFDQVQRLQFDLETTGLHADRDRIFLIAIRDPDGRTTTLEAHGEGDAAEADLIARFVGDDPGDRSRRDREPQPPRIRPALPASSRGAAARAAGARAHRPAGPRASARRNAASSTTAAARGGGSATSCPAAS